MFSPQSSVVSLYLLWAACQITPDALARLAGPTSVDWILARQMCKIRSGAWPKANAFYPILAWNCDCESVPLPSDRDIGPAHICQKMCKIRCKANAIYHVQVNQIHLSWLQFVLKFTNVPTWILSLFSWQTLRITTVMVIMNNHLYNYRNPVISCRRHLSKTAKSHCHELLSDIKTENHTTTHTNLLKTHKWNLLNSHAI